MTLITGAMRFRTGGVWRIPPSFDGHERAPLPRFTALNPKERARLRTFFADSSKLLLRCLRPGAHVFVAGNAFLSQLVFEAIASGGLEFRGEIIRLVGTLRGGDKPKGAELEYPEVCSMPRGAYEPWGLFRKPLPPGMTVADCLREYQTGGLRRSSPESPFSDVIRSERPARREREPHQALAPEAAVSNAPAGASRATARRWRDLRSFYGIWVNSCCCKNPRAGEHRHPRKPRVLSGGARHRSSPGRPFSREHVMRQVSGLSFVCSPYPAHLDM